MEIVITFVLITLLVISLCRLIGCTAKTTVIWVLVADIAYILLVVFFVDLTALWDYITDFTQKVFNQLLEV